ncbi:hypothetical protein FA95DRAFT_1605038 [Auriscalpium vulgare]|uniref:Uncharacterized protein n=1 Tax=Auriscalpium vulgare TaxID=40419 RepID=A0ACB8RXB1_9AGAM|nr:hypothetical protein FA95DRAFT_1605038 [Auriscalpium vulgare]
MASVRRALINIWKGGRSPPKISTSSDPASTPIPSARRRKRIAPPLPLQYPELILFHVLILPFALLLIPHTPLPGLATLSFSSSPNARNLDHPQPPFLDPLTADPGRTLLQAVLGTAAIIPWWAGWVRLWAREGRMTGRGVQERLDDKKDHADVGKRVDMWNAWVFTGYAALFYNFVSILFGAPITSHLWHTGFLSLLLSFLTVFIPAYALGPPVLHLPFLFHRSHKSERSSENNSAVVIQNDIWVRIFAEQDVQTPAERAMLYPAVGALSGAWVGVIPIGLDWDRPWQAYPLTPAYFGAAGYLIGAIAALVVSAVLYLAGVSEEEDALAGGSTELQTEKPKSAAAKKNAKAKEREKRKKVAGKDE